MKKMMFFVAVIAATASSASFAHAGDDYAPPSHTATQQPLNRADAAAYPYGDTAQGKTREQVYGELVRAERDGSLDRLNSTVYAHP